MVCNWSNEARSAQALQKEKERKSAMGGDTPSFMPGASEDGDPISAFSAQQRDTRESEANAEAAETERQLLEALAAQDAEIMKLKQQTPPPMNGDSVRARCLMMLTCIYINHIIGHAPLAPIPTTFYLH